MTRSNSVYLGQTSPKIHLRRFHLSKNLPLILRALLESGKHFDED